MSFYAGINMNYMYGMGCFGLYSGSFNPFGSYCFNYFYNPFSVFNTAMQFMSGNTPSYSSFYSVTPLYSTFSTMNARGFNSSYGSMYSDFYHYQPKTEYQSYSANSMYNPNLYNYDYDSYSNAYTPSFTSLTKSTKPAKSTTSNPIKPKYSTLKRDYLNQEFLDKTKQVAKNINCDYEDLLAIMNAESSLNPSAVHKNKKGEKTAVGLIQFTRSAAIPALNKRYGLDLTLEKIENMSAIEQLDLVEKYYKMSTRKLPQDKKYTAGDLYAATFLPARADKEILCRKGETNANGKLLSYYESNSPTDLNGDGMITKSELSERISQKRVNLSTFA